MISKKQILLGDSKAFQRLLMISYTSPAIGSENKGVSVTDCQAVANYLLKKLSPLAIKQTEPQALLSAIKQQFSELDDLSLAYIRFCIETVHIFQRATPLDAALSSQISRLQKTLLLHSIYQVDFWISQQPLVSIIDNLCRAMMGWQNDFGQYSDNHLSLFNDSISQLETLALHADTELSILANDIAQKINELQEPLIRFAKRMEANELGKIKNQAAQYTVLKHLKQLLFNKTLPPLIANYIENDIASLFHQILATQGLESTQWLKAKPVLAQLVSIYQSDYTLQHADKSLPATLQAVLFAQELPDDKGQDFLNNISFDLSQLNLGKTIADSQPVKTLSIPEHLQAMDANASQEMLNQVRKAKEGVWFILHQEQGSLRCHLQANLVNYQRILFASFVGQRALVASYDEFAYLVSTQKLQALPTQSTTLRCLHHCLDKLLETFNDNLDHHKNTVEHIQQQKKLQYEKAQKAAAAEKSRLEAQEIARQRAQAAKQAQQERLALEQEQQALKKAELEERMHADLKRHARLSLDSLPLGAWAELSSKEGSVKRIKLAVKFAATGRFVFVDDDGITVLEEMRDNLVDMLLSGQLKLLESDQKFAERLAKIVSDLRSS